MAACVLALAGALLAAAAAWCPAKDYYPSLQALRADRTEGRDFRVTAVDRGSAIAVFAIHGGDIERGTSELARLLAGGDWSLYLFEGARSRRGRRLHITAANFDDPAAVALSTRAALGLSVHVQRDTGSWVCVGGANETAKLAVGEALAREGFKAEVPCRRLQGRHPRNIVNRAARGGVQLELTAELIRDLLSDRESSGRFAAAIRSALLGHLEAGAQPAPRPEPSSPARPTE